MRTLGRVTSLLLLLLAEWRPARIARVFPLWRGCWRRDCDRGACKVVEGCDEAISESNSEMGYSDNRIEVKSRSLLSTANRQNRLKLPLRYAG